MKKRWPRILLIVLCTLLLLVLLVAGLYFNELRSLFSLTKLDEYGMFSMTYYGDYGFDEFLKTGAKSDQDIEAFVTKRLLKGIPIDLNVTDAGCTAFVIPDENGHVLYGRNFDFDYAPSMQLYTKPDDGYASVSTVNLAFAGYSADYLPDGVSLSSFLTLAAPYLPFDGMNEKGVTMALLAVPEVQLSDDPNKVTLNTTTAIRLVLDKAATIDEAVALLRQYNLYFSGDVDCHFLIADATGASVLVEFWDGELQTTYPDAGNAYQIATNFIAYNGMNKGEGGNEFERYDAVQTAIIQNNNRLSKQDALALLQNVGCYSKDGSNALQWTVLYDLTDRTGTLFAARKLNTARDFALLP